MAAAGAGNLERALKLIDCAYEIGDAAHRGGATRISKFSRCYAASEVLTLCDISIEIPRLHAQARTRRRAFESLA